jgi:asparagine synthase (glutamine-hydrolysing)
MCGIAGYFHINGPGNSDTELLGRMLNILRHRGPDEFGAYFDNRCALGQARLSIIDLVGGSQPLSNEDGSIWITFNGEIYNYVELRPDLERLGHKFRTNSDTEVIVHAYEEWGADCFKHFNGQWAFAIYDKTKRTLFLARDRLGVRPLFYAIFEGRLYFASEIKAIFCNAKIPRKIDYFGLDEIFTLWTTAPPRTAFSEINELQPGAYLLVKDGSVKMFQYWQMEFPEIYDRERSLNSWAEELHALLVDAVRLRLRADVPVGAYLSGGLDSSSITSLIKHFTTNEVETFSIAFHDKAYDESRYQNEVARHLGTNHHQIRCEYKDIAENFPEAIWHIERPILRTAPVPLFMLSDLVRQNDFKVVLTGEGSDEILGGYDIFKETLIRWFWSKDPNSRWRPLLLNKLYPTLPLSASRAKFYLETFYKEGLSDLDKYYFSHVPRINVTSKLKEYFTPDVKAQIGRYNALEAFGSNIPQNFYGWHLLVRAQYLEARTLLSGYLLSSQGDRVMAGHSIEGRFPFLDHRVVDLGAKIPPWHKMLGLKEKLVLKKAVKNELPQMILSRVKQPYMAPDSNSFVQPDSPGYIAEMLGEKSLIQNYIFDAYYVSKLREKCTRLSHAHLSFKDNMSFIGILSTQILVDQYINNFAPALPLDRKDYKVWYDDFAL